MDKQKLQKTLPVKYKKQTRLFGKNKGLILSHHNSGGLAKSRENATFNLLYITII